MERQRTLDAVLDDIKQQLKNDDPTRSLQISKIFHDIEKDEVRKIILDKNTRADGRKPDRDQADQLGCRNAAENARFRALYPR